MSVNNIDRLRPQRGQEKNQFKCFIQAFDYLQVIDNCEVLKASAKSIVPERLKLDEADVPSNSDRGERE